MRTISGHRERWIPPNSTAVRQDGIDAVVYTCTNARGQLCAVAYAGKRTEHDWYWNFQTEEQRQSAIKQYFDERRKHADIIKERRESRKAFRHTLQVGNILDSSWGYDQTNVDYYEVVSVPSDKTVVVRKIESEEFSDGALTMTGRCIPCPGKFIEKEPAHTCRVNAGNYITIDGHGASLWDGRPRHYSSYA